MTDCHCCQLQLVGTDRLTTLITNELPAVELTNISTIVIFLWFFLYYNTIYVLVYLEKGISKTTQAIFENNLEPSTFGWENTILTGSYLQKTHFIPKNKILI